MSLEKEIERWIKSPEFVAFYEKAEYTMTLLLESKEGEEDHLKPYLTEIGRRYNHFLFTVTEDLIKKAHEKTQLNPQEISLATTQFIGKLEQAIQREYPWVFAFFLKYRENTKKPLQ